MSRILTQDISTGNLRQISAVISSGPQSLARNDDYYANPSYRDDGSSDDGLVRIAKLDADAGWSVRHKLRATDTAPPGSSWVTGAGTQKAQTNSGIEIQTGDVLWIAFSAMFETWNWPSNRVIQNFLITDAIHGYADGFAAYPRAAMCVGWGMPPFTGVYPFSGGEATTPGNWVLWVDRHPNGPTEWYDRQILLQVPITLGRWYDVKMRVHLAAPGSVKCWINNQPQTLVTGGVEYVGDVTPRDPDPSENWRWQHCIYRGQNLPAGNPNPIYGDAIMYRANTRIATTESAL